MTDFNGTIHDFDRLPGESDEVVVSIRILPASVSHYSLACFDDTGVRHYWVDTNVGLGSAPSLGMGISYVSATLVVLRQF